MRFEAEMMLRRRNNSCHSVNALLFLFLLLAPLVPATGGSQARATAAQLPLPARLTDSEFWNLIATYSESGGTFPAENFTSNEISIGQLATELRARGRTGGAYLGVGPEQNFTYIAALRPDIVFIVDIRRQAIIQHLMYKAVFELSKNRSEFIGRLFSMPVQAQARPEMSISQIWDMYQNSVADSALFARNLAEITNHLAAVRHLSLSPADVASLAHVYNAFYRLGPAISYRGFSTSTSLITYGTFGSMSLNTDIAGIERSFLANEADFQFVKGLHSRNMFIPIVGDFGGLLAIRSVAAWLQRHRTTVSAYYVSNVEEYLRPNDALSRFHESALTLPLDSLSVFIRPAIGNPNNTGIDNDRFARFLPPSTARNPDVIQIRNPISMSRVPSTPPPAPEVQNPQLGSITGIVTDSATGSLLGTALITVQGTNLRANTDSTGRFVLPNLPSSLYTLRAGRIGYAYRTIADVSVVTGSPTVVDVKLVNTGVRMNGIVNVTTLRGVVTYETLSPQGARPHVALCPMQAFLAAYNAGRIITYNHVKACVS